MVLRTTRRRRRRVLYVCPLVVYTHAVYRVENILFEHIACYSTTGWKTGENVLRACGLRISDDDKITGGDLKKKKCCWANIA